MSSLRLVVVEDSQEDAELLRLTLIEDGFEPLLQRVENEAEYLAALQTNPDLILCDYGLPQFSTRRALEVLRERSLDVPFIIVSGHIGDDVAVAMLKAGANDYVLKDNLARLAPAVERELRESDARRRQRRLEQALRIVADAVSGVTGKAFLESLVIQLKNAIEADCVFIGELVGARRKTIQAVVVCGSTLSADEISSPLNDSIVAGKLFSGNRETEPRCTLLATLGMQSYLGTLLVSSAGDSLGVMVVMHGGKITNMQVAETLLQIYAVRAASELERMAHTAELEFQATHDPLTQLANRTALQRHMAEMINGNGVKRGALLLIDLDRFKEINDTLGHLSGDEILKQIGPRLQPLLRPGQLLCRLGGDEFAVLVTEDASREKVEELAVTLLYAIREPFDMDGIRLQIGASIGITLYPEHSRDAIHLLRQADVAMYLAKGAASGHRIYDSALDTHTKDRLLVMTDLRHAIENNELRLHYQPKIRLSQEPDGMSLEALIRWQHPAQGLLMAGKFVPFVEMTDLIGPLTLWVMDAACIQCREWRKAGYRVNLAVNISARNLLDGGLPDTIAEIVRQHGIKPEWLEFEITESALMKDPEGALRVLQRIADRGHRLSIDDFGTGYSSLVYLSKLPVHYLKIDRAFVSKMMDSPRDASIVQSTIALAHNLNMRVIAEGVEDKETLERLRDLGCDQAQGYFISKPKPAEEIEGWMEKQGWRDVATIDG